MCGTGDLQACEVMYAYEMARSGMSGNSQVSGGSPAGLYNTARSHHIRKPRQRGCWHHPEIDDRRTLSSQHTPRRRGCRTTRALTRQRLDDEGKQRRA